MIYALVCVLFVIAAYRRPVYALAGLLLVDPFAIYHYIGETTVTLPKAALLGCMIGLCARYLFLPALRAKALEVFRDRRVQLTALAILCLLGATALSIFQADFKAAAVRETFKAAEYFAAFLFALLAWNEDREDFPLWAALFGITAIVAILAIAQEFTGAPSAMRFGSHIVGRIAGPLEGPNQLAGYLGLLLPLLVAYLLMWRRGAAAVPLAAGWIVTFVAIGALFLTFSRAGVAAAFIALLVVLLAARVKMGTSWLAAIGAPLVVGAVAVIAAGGEISHFWSTASNLEPEGLGTRRQLWSAAYQLWRAHPWLGIGADNYEFELGRVGYPELRTHPNGQFLQALVEGGIPLFAALLWATIAPIWALWTSKLRSEPIIAGVLGALTGLAFHQLLDSMMFFPKVGMTAWILTGVGLASLSLNPRDQG